MIRILIVALLASRSAIAQPKFAVGRPLPDDTMAAGTVVVRVAAGDPAKPVANVVVTLDADKKSRTEKTDSSGRVQFANIPAKASVTVSVKSAAPDLARSTFVMPASGGIRLILSTEKWKEMPMPGLAIPKPIEFTGMPLTDGAAGTLVVRLTYNRLDDPRLPTNVPVTLVGYSADNRISVVTRASDAKGLATFTGLDTTELTAYYALAQLPRNGRADRLVARNFVSRATAGTKIVLSSHDRDDKQPPIDVSEALVARNKLQVEVTGVPDPAAAIEVVDAVTGKSIAKGTPKAGTSQIVFDVKTISGQVLYAQTTARGETYRSPPQIQVADRGASLRIMAVPRLLQRFRLRGSFEGNLFGVQMKLELQNNSWIPVPAKGGIEVPFPAGFTGPVLADDTEGVTLTRTGMTVKGPLPPGGRSIIFGFWLPVRDRKVRFAMDLPAGAVDGSILIDRELGVELEMPPAGTRDDTADSIAVSKIQIPSKQSLVFTVTAPKPLDPKQAAIVMACKSLNPSRRAPLKDLPMVDFTASTLDGSSFKLSSLRGKQVILAFNATWNGLRQDQATLPALATALGKGTEVIVVLSDGNAAEIKKVFGAMPFRVVLDPPKGDDGIGPITRSWGISKLPETYVVDRAGTVRAHFINQRDWSTKDAAACLKVLN